MHLMVNEPVRYVEDFAKCGADLLTVHYEACKDVRATLEKIKEAGMKCSVAISPDTEVSKLEGLLDIVDVVLVMSVYPGFGGQKFIRDSLEKVRKLDNIRKESKFDFLIEIDGGVNIENAKEIAENGVDWIVAGTAVFGGDIKENIRKLKGNFKLLLENIPLGRTVEIFVDREGYRYRLTSKAEYVDKKICVTLIAARGKVFKFNPEDSISVVYRDSDNMWKWEECRAGMAKLDNSLIHFFEIKDKGNPLTDVMHTG